MTEREYQKRYTLLLEKLERTFARQMKPLINTIFRAAANAVDNGHVRDADIVVNKYKLVLQELLIKRHLRTAQVFGTFVDVTASKKNLIISRKKLSETFWNSIRLWAKTEAARNISYIADTQKKMIATTVFNGLRNGKGSKQIARDLRKAGQIISPVSANMIARTETHNAAGFASQEMSRDLGISDEKKWLDAFDERVRIDHRGVEGGDWIPENKAFNVGGELMAYPGAAGASAKNVINCRCVAIYRRAKNKSKSKNKGGEK